MLNSMHIYSRTKQTSIEVFTASETIKQLPLKYLSSYSLTLTEQQISDLNSNGSIQIDVNSIELNKAKYVKLILDNRVILLERQSEMNGMAVFGASFIMNPGMIQLIVSDTTTAMLYLQDITLSMLENDAGFITQDDVDLTNYYTKTETDGKYAKLSLYGDKTISVGRAENSSIGDYSVALGGANNIVSGTNSVAIGNNITVTGGHSFAEGGEITLEGSHSHAEGYQTNVSGDYSHAEGWDTEITGDYSHAEGWLTKVTQNYSHAEGHHTIAAGECQHVQGRTNIEDAEGVYAHIVGNGNYVSGRYSNAHTLDWDGNGWFAGDVYVGSTSGINKDEGSKKLATEEYVNNNLAIKTISENIAFVNGTKPSYTNGWYNFTGTITINGTDVSSNGYWDETSLIQIKDDGDRVYFYFIDPDDIEHKDYLSAYVYYDVEAGIWKPEENDTVYTKKVLTKENTNEYTPKADYNPATKKYVDDAIAELKAYIDNAIANAVFAADAADHEPTTTVE